MCAAALTGAAAERILARRRLADIATRVAALVATPSSGRSSDRQVDALLTEAQARLAAVETRLEHRHRVTDLPTREPLLHAMAAEGTGTIGVVAFADFDRMCAFDESLGERMMVTLVDRMRRMIGPARMLAHVDRAQIAIWFGSGVTPDDAQRELHAVTYALSDRLDAGPDGGVILPEVRSSVARLESTTTPQATLTRAVAMLHPGIAAEDADAVNPITAARDRYAMEQDLRQAIARGEFEMLYQPLIDADAGAVVGAEALLRWHHPTRGTIPPSQFVPLVESIGLADEVGLWTLNAACREARAWQTRGLGALHVAVNTSGHQLDRADMRALVERTLARHSLAPAQLEIELTESVAAGDVGRAARLFDELRHLGVRIAIDDFGTGYSSLSALRQLSFDKIKIDREFVTDVDRRPDSQAICQSIIALGRGLGIRVLAEGVERAEEYRWLRGHGCSHFQGYYFAQPLGGEAFVVFAGNAARLTALLDTGPRAARQRLKRELRA